MKQTWSQYSNRKIRKEKCIRTYRYHVFKSRQENVPNFGVKPDKRETKINMVTSLLSCVQFLPCNTAITLYAVAERKINQPAMKFS